MCEDLKKILPYISDTSQKKTGSTANKNSDSKKKPDLVDKEVLSLTNGLFPIQPSSQIVIDKNRVKNEWILSHLNFSNELKLNKSLFHWVSKSDKDKIFPYEKFNIFIDIVNFSESDYNTYLNNLDPEWTYEETCYLWDLCRKYDLRFLVIYDRYDEKYKRTVEDIKKRYYEVSKKILQVRNETSNPLINYIYDANYERIRKYQLEKYIMRPREKNEEEKNLIEEIKKLEQKIKKEEKEQQSLQKLLKIDIKKEEEMTEDELIENEQSFRNLNEEKNLMKKKKEKICFLRGALMHAPLPISQKMNKKLASVLSELNIPIRPLPTAENEELYDQLREQILIWFTLQKHLKKKEIEKQNFELRIERRRLDEAGSQITSLSVPNPREHMGTSCSTFCATCQKERIVELDPQEVQQVLNENVIPPPHNILVNIAANEEGCHSAIRSKIKDEEDKNEKNDQNYNLESYKKNENKIIHIQSNIRGYNARKGIETKKNKNKENQTKNNANPKKDYLENENELGNGGNNRYFETDKELNISTKDITKREKRPPYTFKSGAVYEGEWLNGARDGFGTHIWADGAKYIGEWKNNKAHGKGKFYHIDGDIFEGTWADDKATGYGVYVHINGAKYEGEWKNDLQNGLGVETWSDGSKYEGNYLNGKKNGQGIYIWKDKSKYVGEWECNRISGKGTYHWVDGRTYEGQWQNNNMHGKGIYKWPDGRIYEGEYQDDKKNGFGVYIWSDGKKYEGNWLNGKQHGEGKFVQNDGRYKYGIWENGKRTKWIEDKNN